MSTPLYTAGTRSNTVSYHIGGAGLQQPDYSNITIKGNNGAPDISLVDHILFLEWFADTYFPEAREKFKCIQDITK